MYKVRHERSEKTVHRALQRGWHLPAALLLLLTCLILLAGGCATTPVKVEWADPRDVHRELTVNVLATGELSGFTKIVLNRWNLAERFQEAPEEAMMELHQIVVDGRGGSDEIFALAELSFQHAEKCRDRSYYLASAVYAYAFLFPHDIGVPPNPFDPRLRDAADFYNRGITAGFASPDSSEVILRGGVYRLPFGQLDVLFDPDDLHWADRQLEHFLPVAELEVRGLRNRYRQPGIGAPLAAATQPLQAEQETALFVASNVRVPVTALLRLDDPRSQLASKRLHAVLEVYTDPATEWVAIDQQVIPLESEPTAVLATQLSQSEVWEWELLGFLKGDLLSQKVSSQLVALEPFRPDRIPVVFVHGTASSPARWADMFNELGNDPRIRERFQFWFFSYSTGNPIPYSALQLRDALQETVQDLDPEGKDPALQQMVVIGHSQGGLLTKMIAIDTGTKLWDAFGAKPLDELKLQQQSRDLLRRAFFLESLPFVRRVIFIATPHRGSYIAGNRISHWVAGLISLPVKILDTATDIFTQNPDVFPTVPSGRIGSVYAMTPGSPFIKGLAAIPVAPQIAVNSIVAVKGDGPMAEGSDGVVEYISAHLEDADSELVVRSGHSTQANPLTIEEVRRILLLHAAEACANGLSCPDIAAAARR